MVAADGQAPHRLRADPGQLVAGQPGGPVTRARDVVAGRDLEAALLCSAAARPIEALKRRNRAKCLIKTRSFPLQHSDMVLV